MLVITLRNDGTGTDESANYDYEVSVNWRPIADGRIEGHNRADGWRVLALEAVAPGMLEALKTARDNLAMLVADDVILYYRFDEIDQAIAAVEGE